MAVWFGLRRKDGTVAKMRLQCLNLIKSNKNEFTNSKSEVFNSGGIY